MMGDKGKVSIETIIAAGNTAISDMVSATAKWAACGTEIEARKFAYTLAGASEAFHRMLEILTPLAAEEESDVVSAADHAVTAVNNLADAFCNSEAVAESLKEQAAEESESDSEPEDDGDEEVVERMQEAEQKSWSRQRLNLDTGKVRALREAGWSIKKIADEMGVSETAITTRLKEMGLK